MEQRPFQPEPDAGHRSLLCAVLRVSHLSRNWPIVPGKEEKVIVSLFPNGQFPLMQQLKTRTGFPLGREESCQQRARSLPCAPTPALHTDVDTEGTFIYNSSGPLAHQ